MDTNVARQGDTQMGDPEPRHVKNAPELRQAQSVVTELQLELEDGEYEQSLLLLDELVYRVILLRANQLMPDNLVDSIVATLSSSFEEGDLTTFRRGSSTLEKLVGGAHANHVVAFVLSRAA